jgi:hypothetical protein
MVVLKNQHYAGNIAVATEVSTGMFRKGMAVRQGFEPWVQL